MIKKLIIILIIIFIPVAVWYFLYFGQEVMAPSEDTQKSVDVDVEVDLSILSMLINTSSVQVADLVAVDESNSSGTAYRLFKDGVLWHAVVATMPDIESGNSYESWLVQPEPLEFFSTGIMKKNQEGKWILEYRADNEYPTYLKTVITEETVVDATPEVHILEGSFESIKNQ